MTFSKLTIRDVPLDGKTVLVRADYNVPLDEKGKIEDDFRIRASLPTLKYLLEHNCKIVIISHLGRPDGKKNLKFSLEPVAERLAELVGEPIRFVSDTVGDRVRMAVKNAPNHSITVLENLRFYPGEEADDMEFAEKLAASSSARYFVQDGFGVVHRAHASTDAITNFLPSVSGLLLEKEVSTITTAMQKPKRPLVAIMGGAKVSDKVPLVEEFVAKADQILIGGAMANTFLAANGLVMGKSKIETDQFSTVERIYEKARKKAGKTHVDEFLRLPHDVAVTTNPDGVRKCVPVAAVAPDDVAFDIGDKTINDFVEQLQKAKTVVWNGTLGLAEKPNFAHGSARIALELAKLKNDVTSIIGGGDTADFVLHWDSNNGGSFTHVSTGGGASLELMAGEKLPGVEALMSARHLGRK